MPGNSPAPGRSGDVTASDSQGTGRGRKRYCKKCTFTCTDAREFTAHQASHSVSDDKILSSVSSQISSSTLSTQPRRILRPKRNSKGSVSEQNDIPSPVMEVAKEEFMKPLSLKDNIEFTPMIVNTEIIDKAVMPSNSSELSSLNLATETDEELMDDNEDKDEPDSMTLQEEYLTVQGGSSNESRQPNDTTDKLSADEDRDEQGRLVIDDDSLVKSSSRSSDGQTKTYSCQMCGVTTTSAKSYIRHMKENHSAESFECDLCDFTTDYKQNLARHRKLHFMSERTESTPSSFYPTDKTDKSFLNHSEDENNLSKFSFLNTSKCSSSFVASNAEDIDVDEDDDDDTPAEQKSAATPLTITPENIDQVLDEDKKKKKKTRQEVDPGKYFEAVDSSGTKYACSQCGNIYKWRKSLNKHWKEKHSMDPLVEMASPPGMLELLKSGKYTQLGARRIYDKTFLATIKTNKSDDPSIVASPHNLAQSPSPPNFLSSTPTLSKSNLRLNSTASSMMPLGPFVANTAQPVFPGMPLALSHLQLHNNGHDSPEESALDLTRDSKPSSSNSPYLITSIQDHRKSFDQEQPLDFSKSNKVPENVKPEKHWDDFSAMKPAHSINQLIPRLHHCSKCDFKSTSEVEFANHTSSHLNKRIVRCYECKLQHNSMDELNNHFIKHHFRKLTDYKEAIKKIPHGLQQTYHILNMEIQDIGELGNQDLGASEGKSLKCKKCDFEAKWPAELQKHAVSHSEERPYICMVCGSTYKWKWDLVKHFQKSHPNLPNPYRRNDKKDTPDGSSEDEDEPQPKRMKHEMNSSIMNGSLFSRDDNISVEGIIAATQAGQRLISSQPNILDDEPSMDGNLAFLNPFTFSANSEMTQVAQIMQAAQAAQEIDRCNKAQKAIQEAVRNRQNSNSSSGSSTSKKNSGNEASSPPSPSGSKSEELPYKCTMCNYHARWPSEVTQHMKNHSDSKPYLCPRCEYRSKWKWDVVKHLKRCGGGSINDVIDTTKSKKRDMTVSNGPPNAVVSQQGKVKKMTPQPSMPYMISAKNESEQDTPGNKSGQSQASDASSGDDLSRPGSSASNQDLSNCSTNNNDSSAAENNVNNNYTAYASGLPFGSLNSHTPGSAHALAIMNSINSSNSPAQSPAPSPVTHTTHFRQGAEIWNCPHCPFTTQSQAELKRHSGLHSDDKPFKCDVCQYSTRWACDLKKHRKSYNHFPRTNIQKEDREKTQVFRGRFKCTQCKIFFLTLQNLLDHRAAEHTGQDSSQNSPAPATEIEIDEARIKHPRKQVKKIECPKCQFVCKSRQTMEKHMDDHEQLELSGILCFYCSSLFRDKESLLDHITTHSAFNPKEWETFFMITDEDQHQMKDEGKVNVKRDYKLPQNSAEKIDKNQSNVPFQKKYIDAGKMSSDSTEARIQQILNEVPRQLTASQQTSNMNTYKCEWCSAEFVNLTSVYKHASQAHPIQLKEQDVSMTMAGQSYANRSSTGKKLPVKKPYSGDPIEILKQQIAEKRHHQLADKCDEMQASKEATFKSIEDERGGKRYSCDKCNFSSANLTTYQRHYELHGSKLTSQCWFCDYSVDRMNLLYQHMKISHTRKWKALSQDPRYANQVHRMNMAFASSAVYGNNNDSPPDVSQMVDLSAVDLTSKNKTSHSELIHDIMYITKQQYTWSGIPVNIVPVGNALNFVCPHCAFHDASIAETCSHVMQSHRAMSKFTCKTCQFSDDNIHVMSDHCKTEHPIQDRIVEVLDFKQINFSELQIVQLNALREQMSLDLSRNSDTKTDSKVSAGKPMSCPFCPFKTFITEHMKLHVSNHSRQARNQCHICDFSSESTSAINDHIKVHDANYTVESTPYTETKLPVNVKKEVPRKMIDCETKFATRMSELLEINQSDQEGSPRLKSGKRIRYRCSACPYHTTCRSNMAKHVRQHNNNKKYKCTKCSYGAARAVLLKNHLDSHETPIEDDGQYHDILCDPNSPNQTFKADETEETEIDAEDCEDDEEDEDENSEDSDEIDVKAIVDLETKDILEAEAAHIASVLHDDGDGVDKQFRKQKCPYCPFSSNAGYEFRKHINFHGTQERYKCDHCSYSLDRLNLLSQHRKLHADEPGFNPNPPAADLLNTNFILQQNTEAVEMEEQSSAGALDDGTDDKSVNQFLCSYCPYKESKKKLFDLHCSGHEVHKRYICDFCDWSADRMGLLYHHRILHENEPTYNPSPEDKMFLNQEFDDGTTGEFEAKFMEIKHTDKQVDEHEMETMLAPPFKLTVVKKSYPCKLCPFKTSSKNSYSVHKCMHDTRAEFSCTECSYSSVTRGLLQQHLRLHITAGTSIGSPVPTSARSPLSSQQSSDTEMTHAQQNSYMKKGYQKASTVHLQNHEGPELKCQRCPFTASSHSALKEHMRCHATQDSLTCPYCDFSATSRQIMFPHIQIHFPGTKLELEALELILEEHSKATNNNIHNTFDSMSKSFSPKASPQPEKEAVAMKRIYVCQFCEREFEAKHQMMQHEKQHLLGGHNENKSE